MSVPPVVEGATRDEGRALRSIPFVPHFLLRELFGWTVALALLAGLSAFFPWELGAKADPFAPAPAGIRPEWYFLWVFQALQYIPSTVLGLDGELLAVLVLGIGGAIVVLLPFLATQTDRTRRVIRWVGVLVLLFVAMMTGLAFFGGGTARP